LVALALPAAGCGHWFHRQTKIDIPQMDTVNTQFKFAYDQQATLASIPVQMGAKHKNQAAVTIAAFQKVVDAFPDERLQVGRARLGIAMVRMGEGDNRRALDTYEDLIKNDSDDEVVKVNAMFDAAGILDRTGRFDEAKAYYRKIVDGYTESPDPSYAKMADLSRLFLNRVRTRP
jgi:tetratricopeptide (TPR) repeat protein